MANTIVGALKSLYTKLGGSDAGNMQTISQAIDKVTEVAGGGGGGGGTVYALTTNDYDEATYTFTGPLAQTVFEAAKTGPVVFTFPETTYCGETMLILAGATKAPTGAGGDPYTFDFNTSGAISYQQLDSDGHMLFNVYMD